MSDAPEYTDAEWQAAAEFGEKLVRQQIAPRLLRRMQAGTAEALTLASVDGILAELGCMMINSTKHDNPPETIRGLETEMIAHFRAGFRGTKEAINDDGTLYGSAPTLFPTIYIGDDPGPDDADRQMVDIALRAALLTFNSLPEHLLERFAGSFLLTVCMGSRDPALGLQRLSELVSKQIVFSQVQPEGSA